MGLAGYIDRDKTLNENMNDEILSSQGISYIRREKVKEVTSFQGVKRINAFYRNWGFPNADIEHIRKCIYTLLESFPNRRFYIIEPKEEELEYCKQCYNELMKCIAKENGFDEIIQVERFDKDFFTSIYCQYVRKEISKKRACSFIEHYLSCRVRGMKLLNEKDKEILFLVERLRQLEKRQQEIQMENQRNLELRNSFTAAIDLNNLDAKKVLENLDAKISQEKEELLEISRDIEEIMEKQSAFEDVTQRLLYGTRDIEKDIAEVQKEIK